MKFTEDEGKLQLMFCCSPSDETVELGLGGNTDRRRAAGSLPGFPAGMACLDKLLLNATSAVII